MFYDFQSQSIKNNFFDEKIDASKEESMPSSEQINDPNKEAKIAAVVDTLNDGNTLAEEFHLNDAKEEPKKEETRQEKIARLSEGNSEIAALLEQRYAAFDYQDELMKEFNNLAIEISKYLENLKDDDFKKIIKKWASNLGGSIEDQDINKNEIMDNIKDPISFIGLNAERVEKLNMLKKALDTGTIFGNAINGRKDILDAVQKMVNLHEKEAQMDKIACEKVSGIDDEITRIKTRNKIISSFK